MNYTEIVQMLEKASLFDIYRLSMAMHVILEQPERLDAIKKQLRVGMSVSYFSGDSNKLVDGVVEQILRNNVCVREKSNGKQWRVPLYAINLANIETNIHSYPDKEKLNRNQLQIGETIGFLGDNSQETYGIITQLNPKTATVITRDGTKWRVSYGYLFKVLDTQAHQGFDSKMIDVTPKR